MTEKLCENCGISLALALPNRFPSYVRRRRFCSQRCHGIHDFGNTQYKGPNVDWQGAHGRARKILPPDCHFTDGTCNGRLTVAFRHDAPEKWVRWDDEKEAPFYVGPDPADGYFRLCWSHHVRYDRAERIAS